MGRWTGKACRLTAMLLMTFSYFLVELIVGHVTGSLALVADSFHMLSDVVALIVGLISVRFSRRTSSKSNTFGWARAEVLGAMVNAVFLVALCFTILVEAIQRMINPEGIENVTLLLIVGGVGLLVNLIGLALFHNQAHGHSHGGGHGHSHGGHGSKHEKKSQEARALRRDSDDVENSDDEINLGMVPQRDGSMKEVHMKTDPKQASAQQLNMKGVFLHVLGDALGSVIVMISGLIYMFIPCHGSESVLVDSINVTNDSTALVEYAVMNCEPKPEWVLYIDPVLSMILVGIILSTSLPLLRDSGMILMQTVPEHIVVSKMQSDLEKIDGVLAVHEFHVWSLAGNKIVASLHLHLKSLEDYVRISNEVKEYFHDEGVHSVTIQPEFVDLHVRKAGRDCVLECGPEKSCYTDTCCAKKGAPANGNPLPAAQDMDTGADDNDVTVIVAKRSSTASQS